MLYPDEDVLYQLCDTEESSEEFMEQKYTKVPPRQTPQVTHNHVYAVHRFTDCSVKY